MLALGISADDEAALAALTKQFNAENEDVQVTLRVYATESEKNYYLSHNADDCDMYAFNYAFSANRYKDRLLSLDRNACTNRYLVSIVNGLRASDESLYVLPVDGYYYTQCFNVDMLTARGLELPFTFTDLKMLASRLKAYASGTDEPSSASVGGTDSVLFALMSVAYPQYLNTVRVATFLSRLADGGVSVLDEEYRTEWEDIFENLQMLYDENFYFLQDISQSLGKGLSRFNGGEAYALQNGSNVNAAKDISKDLNVKYTAFVGNEERDACFGSMPALYLSLSASLKDDGAKLSAAQRILDYFATAEGQNLLHRPDTGNEYISYLKRSSSNLPEIYADLQDKVNEGRLFVVDSFSQIFGSCIGDIASYLSNSINLDKLLVKIDESRRSTGTSNRNTKARAGAGDFRATRFADGRKNFREQKARRRLGFHRGNSVRDQRGDGERSGGSGYGKYRSV